MNPQTRRAHHQCRQRVNIEGDYAAKRDEDERIPFERSEKMALKELDPASRHPTGEAWQFREIVKRAARPRQAERQPGDCKAQRYNRGT